MRQRVVEEEIVVGDRALGGLRVALDKEGRLLIPQPKSGRNFQTRRIDQIPCFHCSDDAGVAQRIALVFSSKERNPRHGPPTTEYRQLCGVRGGRALCNCARKDCPWAFFTDGKSHLASLWSIPVKFEEE